MQYKGLYTRAQQYELPHPRVAFFDLDGTLIGPSGALSPATITSVRALAERGVRVALATGRPWFAARDIAGQLGVSHASMFFSGACILDPRSESTLRSVRLQASQAQAAIEYCRTHQLYFECYDTQRYYIERATTLTQVHLEYLKIPPVITQFKDFDFYESLLKIVVVAENEEQVAKVNQMPAQIEGISVAIGTGAAHPHIKFANIIHSEASREAAFSWFLDYFQVSALEVLAFGDAEADVPFLEAAGWGTAVENAPPRVKERARFITSSVENDGVHLALQQILSMLPSS